MMEALALVLFVAAVVGWLAWGVTRDRLQDAREENRALRVALDLARAEARAAARTPAEAATAFDRAAGRKARS